MKLYIARHGQTDDNLNGVFSGWRNTPLNSTGFEQAKKLSEQLKDAKFEVAYQSDQLRAQQTLNAILKFHPGVKIITDKRIRERNYGNLNGRKHDDVLAEFGREQYDTWHRSYDIPPPDGESVEMVEHRTIPFCNELVRKMRKEKVNVLVSCHHNSMRTMRRFFENLTAGQMMKLENLPGSYVEYDIK